MLINWIALFLVVVVAAFGCYAVIRSKRWDAVGGLVFGFAYFIGGPVSQVLIFGQIDVPDLGLAPVSVATSLPLAGYLLAGGLSLLLLLKVPRRPLKKTAGSVFDSVQGSATYLNFHLIAYALLAVTLFVMSGKLYGGHWMESNDQLYSQGLIPSVLGNFYNVLRVTLPGVVLFSCQRGARGVAVSVWLLIAFALFELIVSSNRIVVLFSILSIARILWVFRRRYFLVLVLMAPLVLQFNSIFPAVRGMMWDKGFSADQIAEAAKFALEARSREETRSDDLFTAAFESANVVVIQYVMDVYGRSKPYLDGETILVKPLTFFLPRAVFPVKPEGFNTRVGYAVTGNPILALNATLLGEAFGNFGWFGLFFLFTVPLLYVAGSRRLGGSLAGYQCFFISLAAWRFEFSFFAIGLFVLFAFTALARLFRGSLRSGGPHPSLVMPGGGA